MGLIAKDRTSMEAKENNSDKMNDEELEDLEWSPDQEILLLYSLHGYKPVGPVKYFNMFVIQERLCSAMNKRISSKAIWKKLNNMYDLEALDEAEAELSALEKVDIDFTLPESEFGELMAAKIAGKEVKIKIENECEESCNNFVGIELLTDIKQESDTEEEDTNLVDSSKEVIIVKSSKKENSNKRQSTIKKKDASLLKENITIKKENIKESNKKDSPVKKENAKELKRGSIREDDKKESGKKNTQDVGKDDKKDTPIKGRNRESIVKSVAEQSKKEPEQKKTDQRKTPTQRRGTNQSPSEAQKQVVVETSKRTEVTTKFLRSETPKSLKADPTTKPQKVETLKKDINSDKKKEALEKAERTPEKTSDSIRGSKLRTREKKTTEPETSATKRERSRDSTSKDTADEPPVKKAKVGAPKGRPTRNSFEPQQKSASPIPSPQKRRSRP